LARKVSLETVSRDASVREASQALNQKYFGPIEGTKDIKGE